MELRATFPVLHPLWSITPDQLALHPIRTGAMLTDGVHAPINDKLYRGCASWAAWTPRLGPVPHTGTPAIPPKCRPNEQIQPNFAVFWRMGLRFGESRHLEPLRTHP